MIFFGTFIEGEVGSLTWALLIGGLEYLFAQSLEAVAEGVRSAEVGYLLVVAGLFVIYFLSSRSRQKTSKQGNGKLRAYFQKAVEVSRCIHLSNIVKPSHGFSVNEDLGDGPAAGQAYYLLLQPLVTGYVNLLKIYILGAQKGLGPRTVRARGRCVNHHFGHGCFRVPNSWRTEPFPVITLTEERKTVNGGGVVPSALMDGLARFSSQWHLHS